MKVIIMKLLIVTADDFGYHLDFNDGILECIRAGRVNATSVTVKRGKFSDGQIKELKASKARIGLHVDFGRPLDWAKLSEEEKREGVLKQYEAFKGLMGFEPGHLDGHCFCQGLDEVIAKAMIDLSLEKEIYLRAHEDDWARHDARVEKSDKFLRHFGENFEKELEKCVNGLNELMTHPARLREGADYSFTRLIERRQKELDCLLSDSFKRALDDNKIEMVAFDSKR